MSSVRSALSYHAVPSYTKILLNVKVELIRNQAQMILVHRSFLILSPV